MEQVFNKIDKNRNRFVTSVSAIQTPEDMKEVLEATIATLQEVEARVRKLEDKKIP